MVIGKSKKEVFSNIRDKIWERVQGWNEKTLSKAGKDILIKAVLQAIPTYIMGCFKLPKTFIRELKTLICRFWWDDKEKRKIHWTKWIDLCISKKSGGMGFRDLEAFNLALLAKQAWRIIHNPNNLLSRILKSKYFKSCDFMEAKLGSNPSFTWRSILEARPIIEAGIRWRIGNGVKTRIWGCKWIPRPSIFLISSPQSVLPSTSMVSDLIDSDLGWWKRDLIEQIFWPEEAEIILQIPLGSLQNEDKQVWHYSNTGHFSVRSAYHLAIDIKRNMSNINVCHTSSGLGENWNWLWQAKVPNKIKIFVWRAMKNSKPVAANLIQRHVPIENVCPVYGSENETVLHALLLCPFSRQVWALSSLPFAVYGVLDISVREWLERVRMNLDTKERDMCWTILWAMWGNRNKFRLGEGNHQPHEVVSFAKDYIARFISANAITQIQVTVPLVASWKLPPPNYVKLNFDGALADNRTGLGIIARNHDGECIEWISLLIDRKLSVEVAEASAAVKALELAIERGWRYIVLEGDCKAVIDRVNDSKTFLGSFGVLIEDVKRLTTSFESIQVCHVRRQGNEVAHCLAQLALNDLNI